MKKLAFSKEFHFEYGQAEQLSPLIRRVIANNPGPFTYTGTGVYIVGHEQVCVIDPGPADDQHFEALSDALAGETVSHVLVTHHHMDHSPLAHPLAEKFGAKVYGFGAQARAPVEGEVRLEAGDDLRFAPDVEIRNGWQIKGPGWTMQALETPGHTSNHMAYALTEENSLFCGDHIMGWSTTVISPPDGHMGDYLSSLKKVQARKFSRLYPTHGTPITEDVNGFIQSYIDHRLTRETQILDQIAQGRQLIPEMVAQIYAHVDKRLHPAASHSVLAHIIHLYERGKIRCNSSIPNLKSVYELV